MRISGALAVIAAFSAASCSPEPDVSAATKKCAAEFYGSYNPKDLKQCVDVCIKCDHGTVTTCSTSCTLKGAR
jgi:hypothetical protein